jgi:general secretion pathway protein D
MTLLRSIVLGGALLAASASALSAQEERGTLNFRNAELQAVIEDVSVLTGYTFVVDPQVRGVVNITSQAPMTREEIFEAFLAALRVHGYVAVPSGPGVYQIRPEREGARGGAGLAREGDPDVFVTSVVRLNSASAREAVRTILPMLSAPGSANALDSGNAIVITDFASNVRAMEDALRALDRDDSVVELLTLENVSADEMSRIIERMRAPLFQGEDNRRFAISAAPIPASNSLLIRGEASAVRELVSLARRVDAVSRSNQSFRVIPLSHADGAGLLPILEQAVATLASAEGDAAAQAARRTTVAHHPATNSIIINADPERLRELELVIRQLDVRRPQVLVEAIIVEVSDTAARDLGVQLLLAGDDGSAVPFAATRYGGGGADALAIAGAIAAGRDDDSDAADELRQLAISSLLGARGAIAGIGGQSSGLTFGLILNALEQDSGSNVLSKPSILTLDNEEASFIVGQQIPITTGEVLGANNSNPFRTIERLDVGVQLQVRPQISEGDTIRLYIRQEASSVAGPVSQNFAELITNNRALETTVLADDGEIIVLGGLIGRDEQLNDGRIPGLGSIPGLGRLFRNESVSSQRTNLMIFLRPTIVRSAEDMRILSAQAYAGMAAEQRRATRGQTSSLEEIVDMMMRQGAAFGDPAADLERQGGR